MCRHPFPHHFCWCNLYRLDPNKKGGFGKGIIKPFLKLRKNRSQYLRYFGASSFEHLYTNVNTLCSVPRLSASVECC